MKRLALVLLLLAAFVPATAARAAAPCRDRIYNDWYADGKIASTYPLACYRDALKNVPTDARQYSSLVDDIRSAMQGALARRHGSTNVPAQIGKGGRGGVAGATSKLPHSKKSSTHRVTDRTQTSRANRVIDATHTSTLAIGTTSSGGGGIPLPILALGALALLLAAIGAVGTGVRRARRR
jgi:hypothetical protein